MKPVMLDMCCGAGGATGGYMRAGFTVVGVDIDPQPSYCGEQFIKGDAVKLFNDMVDRYNPVFIHMSPPCQPYSTITPRDARGNHNDILGALRAKGDASGIPYVIENVMASPLRQDLLLCGEMFGLRVIRHRKFEFGNGAKASQLEHIPHRGDTVGAGRKSRGSWQHGVAGGSDNWYYFGVYGNTHGSPHWPMAMDIDWMANRHELAEAIPPAYTEYIGNEVIEYVTSETAAFDTKKRAEQMRKLTADFLAERGERT